MSIVYILEPTAQGPKAVESQTPHLLNVLTAAALMGLALAVAPILSLGECLPQAPALQAQTAPVAERFTHDFSFCRNSGL